MSNSLINKIVKVFSWGLMGISVLITVLFFTNTINEELFIIWAYVLVVIAAVLAVLFPMIYFAANPKNAVKVLLSLGFLGVVFVVAYLMADSTPILTAAANAQESLSDPSVLVFADTGIISTYILLSVAVLALLFTGVRGIFSR